MPKFIHTRLLLLYNSSEMRLIVLSNLDQSRATPAAMKNHKNMCVENVTKNKSKRRLHLVTHIFGIIMYELIFAFISLFLILPLPFA